MDIILLERVEKLGMMGEIVSVKPGYARNYLLPQNKALRATAANRQAIEEKRIQMEAENLERRREAEVVAERMQGTIVDVIRQASESGALYGSVSSRDVADAVTVAGFTIDRKQVVIDRPIKALGIHTLRVRLHPEVHPEVKVNVAKSAEEAEQQKTSIVSDNEGGQDSEETSAGANIVDDTAAAEISA